MTLNSVYTPTFDLDSIISYAWPGTGVCSNYFPPLTELSWNAVIWNADDNLGISKPSWASMLAAYVQMCNKTAGPIYAGDIKYSYQPQDHGFWALLNTDRLLSRTDHLLLYNLIGTKYNQVGDPSDKFRVPADIDRLLMPASTNFPMDSTGGVSSNTLVADNIPQLNTSDLNSAIMKTGGTNALLNGLGLNLGVTPTTIGAGQKLTVGNPTPSSFSNLQPYAVRGNRFIYVGKNYQDTRLD
jgi:microcystin-dependent protein